MFYKLKILLLTLTLTMSVLIPHVSQSNDLLDPDIPIFVQDLLVLSATNYAHYQERKSSYLEGGFVSMGNDPNCGVDINIASIQQVIDNGATEIRLADNTSYSEDLFLSNKSISIRGGFKNCADANNDIQQSTRTLITGTSTNPVIRISGSNSTYHIDFQNLDIRNGQGGDFFIGGGISTLGSDSNLTLDNVNISNNTGVSGGGIAINGGETNIILIDSVVQFNQALRGGGIYCVGSDASVAIFDNSGILENTATGEVIGDGGGGIHLTDGCSASIFSGSSTAVNQLGISGNISESDGGGIFLNDGAQLNLYGQRFCVIGICFGNSSQPVNITNNQTHDHHVFDFYGNGGGVYASGQETEVYMTGILINDNKADLNGGGIYTTLANLKIDRTDNACWDKVRCNYIQGNEVINADDDDTFGGGIHNFVGSIQINNAVFEDNRADYGSAISLYNGITQISGSVINNNGNSGQGSFDDQYVISMESDAELTLEHVTIADNNSENAVIGRTDTSAIAINIYSSIIYDENTGPVINGHAFIHPDINCVIAHETNSMQTLGGVQLLNNDPQFKSPMNRDYHIDAMISPAVDFCSQSNELGDIKDMDGQIRGWDDESISNEQNSMFHTFDAGADETYDNDIIFTHDFD